MTKTELQMLVSRYKETTRSALLEIYNALNKGQKQKLLKNENIVALFERYGVGGDA